MGNELNSEVGMRKAELRNKREFTTPVKCAALVLSKFNGAGGKARSNTEKIKVIPPFPDHGI
jgi:hypothetical protein